LCRASMLLAGTSAANVKIPAKSMLGRHYREATRV